VLIICLGAIKLNLFMPLAIRGTGITKVRGWVDACFLLAERLHKLCSVVQSVRSDYMCIHVSRITIQN
jgi:hypothetical protein